MKKSLFGLDENIAAALAYVGMFITGIIVFVMERENKTLRFHALQSTLLFGGLALLGVVINWIPIIRGLVGWIPGLVMFICWIGLTFVAYKGATIKIPILGDACWEYVHKQ